MPRVRAYRSIDEIMGIFKITLSTVNAIVKANKIDAFSDKWKTQINAKDFYKAYTNNFNPSLFEIWERKKKIKPAIVQKNNADIFQKLFGSPHIYSVKKGIEATALLGIGDYGV